MTPTIWQLGHLWVTDWRSASPELLAPYRKCGYSVIQVHLEDGGMIPLSYRDALVRLGFSVMGAFWAEPESPTSQAEWAVDESNRLKLRAIICNAEDPIEAEDASGHEWSKTFCSVLRGRKPGLGLALNTFSGCGFIDHAAWRKANARLYLQTFPGSREPFAESVESLVARAQSWGWGKSRVKPCFGVYEWQGERADPSAMVASAWNAGTRGLVAYYADGARIGEPEVILKPLIQQAIESGIAY